MSGSGQEKKQA